MMTNVFKTQKAHACVLANAYTYLTDALVNNVLLLGMDLQAAQCALDLLHCAVGMPGPRKARVASLCPLAAHMHKKQDMRA
jgi:hypothetical protein